MRATLADNGTIPMHYREAGLTESGLEAVPSFIDVMERRSKNLFSNGRSTSELP